MRGRVGGIQPPPSIKEHISSGALSGRSETSGGRGLVRDVTTMRRIVLSLLTGLAVAAAARAQFPVQNVPAPPMGQTYAVEVPQEDNGLYVGPLYTVDLEYLLWFLKPQKFDAPVIGTTDNPNIDLGSAVSTLNPNSPSYVAALGPGFHERGPYSGGRLTFTRALPVSFDRC